MNRLVSPNSRCSRRIRLITRAHRDIECRNRLFANNEFGPQGECAGDADALALAAGEFVRMPRGMRRGEADDVEKFVHALAACVVAHVAGDLQRFRDDVAHGHARIERSDRILEDELAIAPRGAQAGTIEGQQIDAVEPHAARGRFDQPHHEPARRGLAATGFADEAEGFAWCDGETDAVHGAHREKVFFQLLHFQHRRGHGAARMQRACWPAPTSTKFGSAVAQTGIASPQRGWKRQPGGRAAGDGTVPSIALICERSRSTGGNAFEQAARAGVARRGVNCLDRPLFDDPAGIHDQHAFRVFAGDETSGTEPDQFVHVAARIRA